MFVDFFSTLVVHYSKVLFEMKAAYVEMASDWGGSKSGSGGSVEPSKVKKANILTILFLMKKVLVEYQ